MLLVNNHFTLVLGIDIHFTTLPPYIPVHPYIGMVLDPSDFIPFIGSTVNINGVPRGVSDTSGIIVPLVHIPLPSPPWLLAPIIGHESTNFFASQTVFADGSRLSPKGYMVMTCNDIGVPLSLQPGTKKPWKVVPTLFAPTSYSLPLVTGAPVNVGGPYVPDWGGMLKNMAMGLGFGGLLKAGKKIKSNRLNDKAARLMSGDKSVLPEPKFSKNTDNIVPLPSGAKPNKINEIKPDPPFKVSDKHKGQIDKDGTDLEKEFNRQLKDQETAINNMSVKDWLNNRKNFENNKATHNKLSNQKRKEYREQIRDKKIDEYKELNKGQENLDEKAKKYAEDYLKGKDALHNPDGVAGGQADAIAGLGNSRVNSSIGSQWGKGRAVSIENQIKQAYGIPPKTIDDIPVTDMMNVKLL